MNVADPCIAADKQNDHIMTKCNRVSENQWCVTSPPEEEEDIWGSGPAPEEESMGVNLGTSKTRGGSGLECSE